ncbi:response regulator [Acidisoma sp.]|uniref:response regulator n=1 Tax=Acidisoma sp. TaxID=1872115 RepID=UPI003AFFEB4D
MKTILLVDDSSTLLMSMASVLERSGFAVTKATSGEDGVQKIRAAPGPFALIITDYNMPGINGVEMIRLARKLPNARFTPILLLTTESEQRKRDDAKAAGATGWLVKPVPSDKLLQAIKQVVPGA